MVARVIFNDHLQVTVLGEAYIKVSLNFVREAVIYLPKFYGDGNLTLNAGGYKGIELISFDNPLDVANDSGVGFIRQPWAANCKPGQITWELLE